MNNFKKMSNRVAFPIIFFSLLIAGTFGVLVYFGVAELMKEARPILQANAGKATARAWDLVLFYYPRFWYTVFPAMLGFALLAGIISWLIVPCKKPSSIIGTRSGVASEFSLRSLSNPSIFVS